MKTKTIPFDLETAKKIQAGEIKGSIKTREGNFAKLLVTDLKSEQPIVAAIRSGRSEDVVTVSVDGCFYKSKWESNFDLILEVPDTKPEFKPFDRVLVRDNEDNAWCPAFYAYHNKRYLEHRVVGGGWWRYCIPYEGNEHLVGTTDKPKDE